MYTVFIDGYVIEVNKCNDKDGRYHIQPRDLATERITNINKYTDEKGVKRSHEKKEKVYIVRIIIE